MLVMSANMRLIKSFRLKQAKNQPTSTPTTGPAPMPGGIHHTGEMTAKSPPLAA